MPIGPTVMRQQTWQLVSYMEARQMAVQTGADWFTAVWGLQAACLGSSSRAQLVLVPSVIDVVVSTIYSIVLMLQQH